MKLTPPGNASLSPSIDLPVHESATTRKEETGRPEGVVPPSQAPSGMPQTDDFREEVGPPPSAGTPEPHLFATDDIIAGAAREPLDLIRARVKTLCASASREFVEDWREVMQVACDMGDAGIAPSTRIELLMELRHAREPLRQTEATRAAFILTYLDLMIATDHLELGNETATKQHLRQGRELIGPLRIPVAGGYSSLLPYVQIFVSGLHGIEAQLHYNQWSRRADPRELERAIDAGRLAYVTDQQSARNTGDPHAPAGVRARLAGYLARATLQTDNAKRKGTYLAQAKNLVTEAREILSQPDDRAMPHHGVRVDEAAGLVAWSEGKLDAASVAFQAVLSAERSDLAATHLMAIALERNALDEAARWAASVKEPDDGFFIYLQGDLEALRAEETEDEAARAAHWRGAAEHWSRFPTDHRENLVRTFGGSTRLYFRIAEAHALGGDASSAAVASRDVLQHCPDQIPLLARTLARTFRDATDYERLAKELASSAKQPEVDRLLDTVEATLASDESPLRESFSTVRSGYVAARVQRQIDDVVRSFRARFGDKGFTLDGFLQKLPAGLTPSSRTAVLVAIGGVLRHPPEGTRTVSQHVGQFWVAVRKSLSAVDIAPAEVQAAAQLARAWNLDREWLNPLLMKAPNTEKVVGDIRLVANDPRATA